MNAIKQPRVRVFPPHVKNRPTTLRRGAYLLRKKFINNANLVKLFATRKQTEATLEVVTLWMPTAGLKALKVIAIIISVLFSGRSQGT